MTSVMLGIVAMANALVGRIHQHHLHHQQPQHRHYPKHHHNHHHHDKTFGGASWVPSGFCSPSQAASFPENCFYVSFVFLLLYIVSHLYFVCSFFSFILFPIYILVVFLLLYIVFHLYLVFFLLLNIVFSFLFCLCKKMAEIFTTKKWPLYQ